MLFLFLDKLLIVVWEDSFIPSKFSLIMGVVFWFFSFVSTFISLVVLALSIASGLYFLSEIAEEFPTAAGKVMKYSLLVVSVCQFILWIDGLPLIPCIFQFCALASYFSTLRNFPFVQLTSWQAIASMILFLVTNGFWLHYFLSQRQNILPILGFFVVIVWLVPCGLFVSLTVNDNVLPGVIGQPKAANGLSSSTNNNSGKGKSKSIFKTMFEAFTDSNNVGVLFPMAGQAFGLLQQKRK